MTRTVLVSLLTVAATLAAFAVILLVGSVDIPASEVWAALTGGEVSRPAWHIIVIDTRLMTAVTALIAGAALSVAGLLLQTTFDNPLAGPSILGISTGASLGVAVVMLALGGAVLTTIGQAAVIAGALAGASAVIIALLAMASMVRSATMLLIVGILVGYLASSAIALLNFFSTREGVHSFAIWGLGNFGAVPSGDMLLFALLVLMPLLGSMCYIKPLNALLLGSRYAESVGVSLRRTRTGLLAIAGVLTAVVTAWCGPIGFIGLVVPHIARMALRTSNHRSLLPYTALAGAAVAVICQMLCALPATAGTIPVNAITPIIGVPVIIYIILRRRSLFYFK